MSLRRVIRLLPVLVGVLAGVLLVAPPLGAQQKAEGPAQSPSAVNVAHALSRAFQEASAKVLPAVVVIRAKRQAKVGDTSLAYSDVGSGVVVRLASDLDPVVLTNGHVVGGVEPEHLELTLIDGTVLHPVRVLVDARADIGVIEIRERDLYAARLGDSDRVAVGQWVLAIGSPFGLEGSVTHGIISARGRRSLALGSGAHPVLNQDFLQTDAAIHPGNSGGPLINLDGEVIAINAAIASTSGRGEGIGFAIPANLARHIALELLRHRRVRRAYLGVSLELALDAALAEKLGLERVRGALVADVFSGTPAAEAGLEPLDVILEVDGKPIEDEDDLRNRISLSRVGSEVSLTVWRDRRKIRLRARLAERDRLANQATIGRLASRPTSRALQQLGILALTLDASFARRLGLKDTKGVVVWRLHPHHPASLSVQILDVIVAIDGKPIASVRDADRLLAGGEGTVHLTLLRPGRDGAQRRTVRLAR